MTTNTEVILKLIQDNFDNLRTDMHHRFDKIEFELSKKVSTESCENLRKYNMAEKTELSLKKITAIGGIITGTITAITAAVVTILKFL